MSSHHSEQMSQRSQVSKIALRRCSQNAFVFVFDIAFVFVFVFVNFLVMLCLLITLNKCLKGQKSLGSIERNIQLYDSFNDSAGDDTASK